MNKNLRASLFLTLIGMFCLCLLYACQEQESNMAIEAQLSEAVALHRAGQLDSALSLYDSLLPLFIKQGDTLAQARIENNKGAIYKSLGQQSEAASHLSRAVMCYRALGDSTALAGTLVNQAQGYKDMERETEAYELLLDALPILEQGQNYKALFSACQTLGNIERNRLNGREALAYHQRAMVLGRQYQPHLLGSVCNNLGKDWQQLGQQDSAAWYYLQAWHLKDSIGQSLTSTLLNMSLLLEEQGAYKAALDTLQSALKRLPAQHDPLDEIKLLLEQARIQARAGMPQDAEQSFARAALLLPVLQNSAQLQRDFLLARHAHLMTTGKYAEAAALLHPVLAANDAVLNLRKEQDMNLLAADFQFDQLHDEIALQQLTIAYHEQSDQITNLIIAITLLSLLVISVLLYRINKERRLRGIWLSDLNHRIRNNLVMMESLLRLEITREEALPQTREALTRSKNRLTAISSIHSKLLTDNLSRAGQVNISGYLTELCADLLRACGMEERVLLEVHVAPESMEMNQSIRIGQLIAEAVTNACKYAFAGQEHPHLRVDLQTIGEEYVLEVADNGPGIPAFAERPEKQKSGSLGMRLFEGFSKELRATWTTDNTAGCKHRWQFPRN